MLRFPFLVHADAAVEIFKRALLPPFFVCFFGLGLLQVYLFSRSNWNTSTELSWTSVVLMCCDSIKKREQTILLCVLHPLASPSVG